MGGCRGAWRRGQKAVYVWFYLSGPGCRNRASHLLEVALHNQVLDIRLADHKSLALLEIDAAELGLYYAAVFDHFDEHMDVLGRLGNARHDVELLGEFGAEFHDGCMILSEVVYLMRGELVSEILVGEQMGQGATNGPVHVAESIDAMHVVCKEAALVSENGRLDDEKRWRWGTRLLDEGQGSLLETALLADDGADEGIIVLEKRIRQSRAL